MRDRTTMMGLPPKPKDGNRRTHEGSGNSELFMSPRKIRNSIKLMLSPSGGNRTPKTKSDKSSTKHFEKERGGFPNNIDLDYDDDDDYNSDRDNDDHNNNSGEVKFLSPVRRLSTAMKIGFQKATGSPTKNNSNSNFDHNGEEYDYDDDDDDERIARSEDGEDMDNTLLLLCKELELIGDGDDE